MNYSKFMPGETPQPVSVISNPSKAIKSVIDKLRAGGKPAETAPTTPEKVKKRTPRPLDPEVQKSMGYMNDVPEFLKSQLLRGEITHAGARAKAAELKASVQAPRPAEQAQPAAATEALAPTQEAEAEPEKSIYEVLGVPEDALLPEVRDGLDKLYSDHEANMAKDKNSSESQKGAVVLDRATNQYLGLLTARHEEIQRAIAVLDPEHQPDSVASDLATIKGMDAYGLVQGLLKPDILPDDLAFNLDTAVMQATNALESTKGGWDKNAHKTNLQAVEKAVLLDIKQRAQATPPVNQP